jgi:hypothetical protein
MAAVQDSVFHFELSEKILAFSTDRLVSMYQASQIDWYTRVQFASVIFQALLIGCYWYKRDDSYDVSTQPP